MTDDELSWPDWLSNPTPEKLRSAARAIEALTDGCDVNDQVPVSAVMWWDLRDALRTTADRLDKAEGLMLDAIRALQETNADTGTRNAKNRRLAEKMKDWRESGGGDP